MSTSQVLVVVLFLLVGISHQLSCSGQDCSLVMQRLRRSDSPYNKRRDQYDFVRFGKRSESAQKKAGYEYVRFGKRTIPNWGL